MHDSTYLLLLLASPAALCAVALLVRLNRSFSARAAGRAAEGASALTLLLGAAAALHTALRGAATSPTVGLHGMGLSVRLDVLSCASLLLIGLVGWVAVRYSRNYLDGEPRQAAFMGRLCATLAAVVCLVVSGNVLQLAAAWVATSLALHGLLVFYPERPRAVTAARKKFWVARIGDVCVGLAAVWLARAAGTADLAQLNEAVRVAPEGSTLLATAQLAGPLLAVAALLKSAQFPTHGWLVEVMETPTPVSALLHAGIVNAGGFLALRFADVLVASPASLWTLAVVGGLTALFGSAAMLAQPAVKTQLAYSTIAQMGFMLFEIGIGAFWMALLHLVAHSIYKAHAFLSAGGAAQRITEYRAFSAPNASAQQKRSELLGLFGPPGVALVASAAVWLWPAHAVTATLVAIVAMGVVSHGARLMATRPGLVGVGYAAGVSVALGGLYLGLEHLMRALTALALPIPGTPDGVTLVVMVGTLVGFGLVCGAQPLLTHRGHPPWLRAAYVHLRHGLYANVLFDRLAVANGAHSAATQPQPTKEKLA